MPNFFDQFDAPAGPLQITVRPQDANAPQGNFFDQFDAAPMSSADIATDVVKSGGIGLAKAGVGILGMPGDVGSLASMGAEAIGVPQNVRSAFGRAAASIPMTSLLVGPNSQDIQKTIEGYTGEFYKPKTIYGEYTQTGAEFAPMLAAPGRALPKLAQWAVSSLASETAGQKTKGTAAEPWARLGGGVVGSFSPNVLGRIITPFPASAARTNAVRTLRNEGVTDLTAGQVTGRRALQARESELGGSRGAALMENQGEQFTQATLRRAGIDARRATPDVIDGAFTRIGNQFETIGARNQIHVDRPLGNAIAQVQADYRIFANPLAKQSLNDAIDDIVSVIQRNNGVIPGDQYNAMRSRLGNAARGAQHHADNQLRDAFYDLQHALDDAMQRGMLRAGNAGDAAALREARNHYRNLLTIERAATTAVAVQSGGIISPAALRGAEVMTQGRRTQSRGRGDFSDLAQAGSQVMTPLPNSGTPMRTNAINLGMSPAGTAAGAGIGTALFGPGWGTGIGGAIGGYLPKAVGRAAVSGPGRAYLGNQLLANTLQNAPSWLQQALLASVLMRPQTEALPPPR